MSTSHCHKKNKAHQRHWATGIASLMAVWGLSFASVVHAFEIGHARIESAPGQPLQFSILLKELSPQDKEELVVRMAPKAIWQELGLSPQPGILHAQVALFDGQQAQTMVARFNSPEIIEQPVIDLVIEVELAQEQQRHQVSMLQQPRPSVQLPAATSSSDSSPASLTVQPGDTLHGLAQRLGSAHGTEYQLLAALYRHNPQAFSRENMNFLLAGQKLQIPTAEQVQALTDREARQMYVRHAQQFNQYKEALARGATTQEAEQRLVAEPEALAAAQPTAADSQALEAPQDDHLAPQGDRLRLSQEGVDSAETLRADDQQAQAKRIKQLEKELVELDTNIQQLEDSLSATSPLSADASGALPSDIDTALGDTAATTSAGSDIAQAATQKPATDLAAKPTTERPEAESEQPLSESPEGASEAPHSGTDPSEASATTDPQSSAAQAGGAAGPETGATQTAVAEESQAGSVQAAEAAEAKADTTQEKLAAVSGGQSAAAQTGQRAGGESAGLAVQDASSAVSAAGGTPADGELSRTLDNTGAKQELEQQMSWFEMHFFKLMLALLFFIIVFTVWILKRANKTTIELEAPDRVTPEMIQAKLDDINLDLDTPPLDEAVAGKGASADAGSTGAGASSAGNSGSDNKRSS